MADEHDTEAEPSIEEILDSIRSIISDDDEEPIEEAPQEEAVEPEPVEEEPESVVEEEPDLEMEDEPEPEVVEEVLELTDPIDVDPEPEPEVEESIFTSKAKNAAYDGFTELARKTAVENDGITLEDIVRTELNPLLREWLDKNLPNIIDRLVREELQKIAKRAESDTENL